MTTITSQTASSVDNGWTITELSQVRWALVAQIVRLRRSLADSATIQGSQSHQLFESGEDETYAGTVSANIRAGSQMADNSDAILAQCELALQRIADGIYGLCEEFEHPIVKDRLLAIPRATKCAKCR